MPGWAVIMERVHIGVVVNRIERAKLGMNKFALGNMNAIILLLLQAVGGSLKIAIQLVSVSLYTNCCRLDEIRAAIMFRKSPLECCTVSSTTLAVPDASLFGF